MIAAIVPVSGAAPLRIGRSPEPLGLAGAGLRNAIPPAALSPCETIHTGGVPMIGGLLRLVGGAVGCGLLIVVLIIIGLLALIF